MLYRRGNDHGVLLQCGVVDLFIPTDKLDRFIHRNTTLNMFGNIYMPRLLISTLHESFSEVTQLLLVGFEYSFIYSNETVNMFGKIKM